MITLFTRRLAAVAVATLLFAVVGTQDANAGLLEKLKEKFSCKKDTCCCEPEPACCEPEPTCDACEAEVVEDCGCGGEVMSEVVVEETTTEASPAEEPTPADPAPEAPEAPESAEMTEKEKRIAEMKAAAAAAVKKAAGESVGASAKE